MLPRSPAAFRAALESVAERDRDSWVDRMLGTTIPEDGPALPAGCVPYLPITASVVLRLIDEAGVAPQDVFVDIGAGVGRAAALAHLLTGATAIGLEIQPHLVRAARDLALRLDLPRLSFVEGDATRLLASLPAGTVFFLNCPFSGGRLEQFLDALQPIARERPIRVCCVDLPPVSRPWLAPTSPGPGGLVVYRST
jgi:SAM-dependent methyltransferase